MDKDGLKVVRISKYTIATLTREEKMVGHITACILNMIFKKMKIKYTLP